MEHSSDQHGQDANIQGSRPQNEYSYEDEPELSIQGTRFLTQKSSSVGQIAPSPDIMGTPTYGGGLWPPNPNYRGQIYGDGRDYLPIVPEPNTGGGHNPQGSLMMLSPEGHQPRHPIRSPRHLNWNAPGHSPLTGRSSHRLSTPGALNSGISRQTTRRQPRNQRSSPLSDRATHALTPPPHPRVQELIHTGSSKKRRGSSRVSLSPRTSKLLLPRKPGSKMPLDPFHSFPDASTGLGQDDRDNALPPKSPEVIVLSDRYDILNNSIIARVKRTLNTHSLLNTPDTIATVHQLAMADNLYYSGIWTKEFMVKNGSIIEYHNPVKFESQLSDDNRNDRRVIFQLAVPAQRPGGGPLWHKVINGSLLANAVPEMPVDGSPFLDVLDLWQYFFDRIPFPCPRTSEQYANYVAPSMVDRSAGAVAVNIEKIGMTPYSNPSTSAFRQATAAEASTPEALATRESIPTVAFEHAASTTAPPKASLAVASKTPRQVESTAVKVLDPVPTMGYGSFPSMSRSLTPQTLEAADHDFLMGFDRSPTPSYEYADRFCGASTTTGMADADDVPVITDNEAATATQGPTQPVVSETPSIPCAPTSNEMDLGVPVELENSLPSERIGTIVSDEFVYSDYLNEDWLTEDYMAMFAPDVVPGSANDLDMLQYSNPLNSGNMTSNTPFISNNNSDDGGDGGNSNGNGNSNSNSNSNSNNDRSQADTDDEFTGEDEVNSDGSMASDYAL